MVLQKSEKLLLGPGMVLGYFIIKNESEYGFVPTKFYLFPLNSILSYPTFFFYFSLFLPVLPIYSYSYITKLSFSSELFFYGAYSCLLSYYFIIKISEMIFFTIFRIHIPSLEKQTLLSFTHRQVLNTGTGTYILNKVYFNLKIK